MARRQAIVARCTAQAEAMTLLHGCELDISLGHRWVIMESNSLESILYLNDSLENGS